MIHDSSLPCWIEGQPKPATKNERHQAMFYLVEAAFEQAIGITLERGRFVSPTQNSKTAPQELPQIGQINQGRGAKK